MEQIKGFKVFNPNWTCRKKQYSCPGTFEEDVKLSTCDRGMHFCRKAADCFNYYSFDPENKVAEVIAYGDIAEEGDKCCTNKLEIVREIPWQELLEIVNTGKGCTGLNNTGDRNTGNWNTGNWNTGNWNTGNRNTGNWNTGNRNTGNCNTGDWNTGDWNTGDRNTGNWNTGNWNTGNRNTGDWNTGNWNQGDYCTGDFNLSDCETGCFCTEEHGMRFFNKESNMTHDQWRNSEAYSILCGISFEPAVWIYEEDMTDEEKAAHPEYETTGGYLKENDTSKAFQNWWDNLSSMDKKVIKSIPNFDGEIFKEITGIDIEK